MDYRGKRKREKTRVRGYEVERKKLKGLRRVWVGYLLRVDREE